MNSINWNRFDYKVNIDFFKKWSPQMAYILGFTFADGNVYGTTLSWDLKKDRELLDEINQAMGSNYPIHKRKASFRLRISNPVVVNDLQNLGVYPNKSSSIQLPMIPPQLFSHFARGFFDGDGWIYIRESRNEISVGFSSGSEKFLSQLSNKITKTLDLTTNNLRTKSKITRKGISSISYQVDYFWGNAYKILSFFYSNLRNSDLFMERKFRQYQRALELYEWIKSGGRKWRELEKEFKQPMKKILSEFWERGYNGPQIANKLGVHHSSVYRWLIKTEVRLPFTEIRRKGLADG